MPPPFAATVRDLAAKAVDPAGTGLGFVYRVSETDIAAAPARLRALVNDGRLLPEKSFAALTGQGNLTPENYPQVVGKLFAGDDVDLWLRQDGGEKYGPEEMAAYKKELAGLEAKFAQRQLNTIKKIAGAEQEQQALARGFALFNSSAPLLAHQSRETYRRLLVAIFGAVVPAEYQSNPKIQHNTALALSTQLAELYLLLAPPAQPAARPAPQPETLTSIAI